MSRIMAMASRLRWRQSHSLALSRCRPTLPSHTWHAPLRSQLWMLPRRPLGPGSQGTGAMRCVSTWNYRHDSRGGDVRASVAALHVTGRRYWSALGRGCALLPRAPRPSPAVGVASASAVGPEAVRSFHIAMDGTQTPSSGSPSSGGGGTKTSGAEAGKRDEQPEQKGETKKPEQPGWYELIDPGIADIPGLLDVVFGANPRAAEPSSVRLGEQAALQLHATRAESDDGVVADVTDALDQESDPDMFDFASDLIVAGVDSLTSTVKLTGDAANAAIVTSGTLAKFAAELAGNTATALIPQLGQVPVSPVVRTGVAAATSVVGAAKHVVDSGVGVATGAGGTAGRLVGSAVRGTVTYVSPTPTPGAGQRAKRTPAAAIGDFAATTASVASTTVDTTVSTLDNVVTGSREAAVRVLAHTVGSEAAQVADETLKAYQSAVKTVASAKGAASAKLMKKVGKEALKEGVRTPVTVTESETPSPFT